MASNKTARKPKPETSSSEPEAAAKPARSISKTDAVRAALEAGYDTPEAGVPFIMQRFGIEIGRQHFSSTKSQVLKREREGTRPKAAIEGYLAPPAGGAGLLDAMEAIKPLVASLGKDRVKRIVDLLG